MSAKVSNSVLNTLPCADGASWDPDGTCLPDTRVGMLDEIWTWINDTETSNMAKIFWLKAVAGAGKSAIAHTIAQRSQTHGLLASSFFFDRNSAGRNEPSKLFSTIARGLAHFDKRIARRISLAIELDQTITTAPIHRQFEKLVRDPSTQYTNDRAVVIIIDALDEGYNTALLKILRDKVPELQSNVRILITSRPEQEIMAFLSQKAHIRAATLDICEQTNLNDISLYVEDRLREIAFHHDLHQSWPGDELTTEFKKKAEGLFVWVSTVSRYLSKATHPDRKLVSLLSERSKVGLPAEEKMDELYSNILDACDWSDEDFSAGYHLFMGAIMAVKTPLSLATLQNLHRTDTVLQGKEVLRPLGSLLTGLIDRNQPIRTLHISLREFLTYRARYSSKHKRFYVDEMEHTQRLALLCLLTLNEGFIQDIPGTGYLSGRMSGARGIPLISECLISEELWYACGYWIDHIVDVTTPTAALKNALRTFLSSHLLVWMEIMASKGRHRTLHQLREWCQASFTNDL